MSFLDDLNRAFTPEGREEALERAYEIPADWDGITPVAPVADTSAPAQSPMAPTAAQPEQQPTGQQPEYPIADPRFEQVRTMVQGVVQENQLLRGAVGQYTQSQQQMEEAAFQARLKGLEEEGKAAEAIALVQQRAGAIINTLQNSWNQERQQFQQGTTQALISGFTQEIIANHPSLTDHEKQLLETIPDPDNRTAWADYFEDQHEQRKQMALQNGAAVHVASGAGRVGGSAPAGATPDSQRNGRESSYDIIRRTPWQTVQG